MKDVEDAVAEDGAHLFLRPHLRESVLQLNVGHTVYDSYATISARWAALTACPRHSHAAALSRLSGSVTHT